MDSYVKLRRIALPYADSLKLRQFRVTQFQMYAILKRKKIIACLNRALNFTLRERKCS